MYVYDLQKSFIKEPPSQLSFTKAFLFSPSVSRAWMVGKAVSQQFQGHMNKAILEKLYAQYTKRCKYVLVGVGGSVGYMVECRGDCERGESGLCV